ncbi:hypothetical protein, variant [Aphanomyces invadans]|uniref:C2 domain-containing protein n=1 Tax=Aphanomyces invadans TaxID=157072 RepID=A0A024THN7_9STRA|nr:hypothetical protein, variant [Aphanomyces invadans]ETV92847.1 hypothetical protein, variant [Aphanomyces invadans]|eukprot:XP_008878616.1 hypothetical protein, variant [Aphanomyces invadans]
MIVEAPTYAAFKRERLIRGPSVLPPFLPLRRDLSFSSTTDDTDAATLAICHSKAMALDRMLRAEVADARRDRLRSTKQAAIAVERRLVLRQNAARLLQRAMRNYKNHQTQRRVDACRCIMHWWRKWKPPKSIHECVSIAQYVESRNVDPTSIQVMPSHSIARQQHPHAVSCTTCALHAMGQVPTSRQQPSSISNSIQQPASLDDSMDQDAPATRGLVLELLALRGLAVASSWTSLHAIICAFHQTRPYTTLETGHIRCHAGELNWDANNVLSWQPHNVGRVALTDWHCTVKFYRHDSHGDAKCVGQVHLPADLLESSLAKNQTLTQWFPLEKAVPGDVVRGEVRISFQYDEDISGVATPRQQLELIDALNTLASPRSTTSSRQVRQHTRSIGFTFAPGHQIPASPPRLQAG